MTAALAGEMTTAVAWEMTAAEAGKMTAVLTGENDSCYCMDNDNRNTLVREDVDNVIPKMFRYVDVAISLK
jgi:hypothetical protein